ncbi:MAG: hypothetical protein LBN10_08745 [Propionibacteriaceae bacterium]|jgi:hypothetical protein|nr:hypothetical protein [Propionibacteriaceae bacterium]
MIHTLPPGKVQVLETDGLQVEVTIRGPWKVELVYDAGSPLPSTEVQRTGVGGTALLVESLIDTPTFVVRVSPTNADRFPVGSRVGVRLIGLGGRGDGDEIQVPSIDTVGLSSVDLATVTASSGLVEVRACVVAVRQTYQPVGAAAKGALGGRVYDLTRHALVEAGAGLSPAVLVAVDGSASVRRQLASSTGLGVALTMVDALVEAMTEQPTTRIAILGASPTWVQAADHEMAYQRVAVTIADGPAVVGACFSRLTSLAADSLDRATAATESEGEETAYGVPTVILVSDAAPGDIGRQAADLRTAGWDLRLVVLCPDAPPPVSRVPLTWLPHDADRRDADLQSAISADPRLVGRFVHDLAA